MNSSHSRPIWLPFFGLFQFQTDGLSKSNRRTQLPSLKAGHKYEKAETRMIYSGCTIIASCERPGLLAQRLACRSMDPEYHGQFP